MASRAPTRAARHPNRLPFSGVLTLIDVASDKAPSGGRGHRVIVTRGAAEAALPSLRGMGLNYRMDWDGHDPKLKFGVISGARIVGNELRVSGYIYARDFPEVERAIRVAGVGLGMSYELANAHVADLRSSIWVLTQITFTGAAVLLRSKAAYRGTSFELGSAAAEAEA
jgi:hypothetical protein